MLRGEPDARATFLGQALCSCEDNILTLVHELFTGCFLPIKSGIFLFEWRKKAPRERGAFDSRRRLLDVVVEEELVRMRTQTQSIVLFALGRDPHLDEIGGEHIALEEELVILLEVVECFGQT